MFWERLRDHSQNVLRTTLLVTRTCFVIFPERLWTDGHNVEFLKVGGTLLRGHSGNIEDVLGTFREPFPERSEDVPTGVKEVAL